MVASQSGGCHPSGTPDVLLACSALAMKGSQGIKRGGPTSLGELGPLPQVYTEQLPLEVFNLSVSIRKAEKVSMSSL